MENDNKFNFEVKYQCFTCEDCPDYLVMFETVAGEKFLCSLNQKIKFNSYNDGWDSIHPQCPKRKINDDKQNHPAYDAYIKAQEEFDKTEDYK